MNAKSGRHWIAIVGVALVVGFFLPWVDIGWGPSVSGLRISQAGQGFFSWLMLVPAGGALMALLALGGSKHARVVSALVGLGLVGYGVVKTVQTFFATTGFGLWLVIAAACAALVVPFMSKDD